LKQIDKWKNFDENIKLNPNIGSFATFLDLYMENRDGVLFTTVYQKPSYEPYYLPFNSIHPLHMKKNIPYTMLLRVMRYCSIFQTYLDEREKLRMALLLNKYPNKLIEEQFNNVLLKCNIDQPLTDFNYDKYRQKVMNSFMKEKFMIDYEAVMFIHFTYCSTMKTFPAKFHLLWNKYFEQSPINETSSFQYGMIIFLIVFTITYCDEHDYKYEEGQKVVLWMNTVGPYHNHQETYNYFSLPFCRENILGVELEYSGVEINYKLDKEKTDFCETTLTQENYDAFTYAIKNHYGYQIFIDDLPIWGAFLVPFQHKMNYLKNQNEQVQGPKNERHVIKPEINKYLDDKDDKGFKIESNSEER
ncbi:unnamed protein product, partial [Rotaria sordida]